MAQFTAPKQIKLQVVMKAETTAGVDVLGGSYTTGDVLNVIGDSVRFTQDPNEIQNLMTAGNLGRAPSILGKLTARVDFGMWIRGKGAAYSTSALPEVDMPLRACGLVRAVGGTSGAETVTYTPTNTEEVFTVYVVQDVPGGNALSAQMVGCLGTCRLSGRAGEGVRADFSLLGALEERADITYVSGALAITPAYPTLKSAAFQIGSTNYAPRIANVGFDLGNTVAPIESINAAGAVAGFKIFDRNPRLSIDPEADREATSTWWAQLRDGAPMNDCTFQVGTALYNRLKFRFASNGTGAQLQAVAQSIAARDGLTILPTILLATIASGNDDYSLLFD